MSSEFYTLGNFNNTNASINKNLDNICSSQLNAIKDGLINRQQWALELIDSWGKIPSGILLGHLIDLGNYDECLKVINDKKINNDYIKGKYCTANLPVTKIIPTELFNNHSIIKYNEKSKFQVPQDFFINKNIPNINLQIGTCFPKICNPEYLNDLIKEFLKSKFEIELNESDIILHSNSCQEHPDDIKLRTIDFVAIVFLSIIAVLMVISSIYDLIMQNLKKKPNGLCISFSILSNGKKLFAAPPHNSDNVIGCLNGIRCLSMLWVLYGHSYAMSAMLPYINKIDIIQWKSSVLGQIIFNANISVDSFFFLSGFLVAWVGFKELNKSKGKLNIPLMYFHRYIRLTPVIAVLILVLLSIFKYFGNGPNWSLIISAMTEPCKENWWSTLLYILNYATPDKPCLLHTWYLSVDMQLFILSPLLLIPTYKWGRKYLYSTSVVLCVLSIGCCFATHLLNEYELIRVEQFGVPDTYKSKIYYATHTRLPPWVVGFVLGYFMLENKSKHFKIPKIFNLIAWIFSITVILTIVFGTYERYQPNNIASSLEATFYESFKRISWAIALSWIVFACHKGYGGIIDSFLSYPFWAVFGRLTYSIYLTHVLVLIFHFSIIKSNFHFSDYEIQLMVWGHFGITTLVSILTVLAFEFPILEIEKFIFGRKINQKNKDNNLRTKASLGTEDADINKTNIE